MSSSKWMVMGVAVLLGMAVVAWIGVEYRDEVKQFLRALLRAL
ncbi:MULTISPECIES: hypothetical protein [Gammaproteobacteria]|jgi:hypothetical protein|uniref:Uncharacterized protein n=1 Tax=Xanthomonas boreopolis TaxID=86183 RepID=A0A919KHL7_9XANT|nr:hypothetical protein [Pseudomonas sp. Hp2]GHH51386.1 hypothetical protein GCM10009090_13580 [[Pseudomonas] boreopolis]